MKLSVTITALLFVASANAQSIDTVKIDSSQKPIPEDLKCQPHTPLLNPLDVKFERSLVGPAGEIIKEEKRFTCNECGMG